MVMAAAGLLAACIVVFAPLAMAGWHLTRNKVLFFSAILFIILAATVHILPHAPSLSLLFSSVHSTVSLVFEPVSQKLSSRSCLHYLYHIDWHNISNSNSSSNHEQLDFVGWSWRESAIRACNFTKFTRDEALDFLSGTWILVAGDSQARFILVSLLQLLLEDPEPLRSKLFKYHSNFEYTPPPERSPHLRLSFVWAPYTSNLTVLMHDLHRNGSYPDLIIMGAGLWHMLHVTNASDYGHNMVALRESLPTPSSSQRLPYFFWMNLPALVPSLLNTEAKRRKMTRELLSAYDHELLRSNLIVPDGPFRLLDIKRLSLDCGADCTADGMHYVDAVYAAAIQLLFQTLKS